MLYKIIHIYLDKLLLIIDDLCTFCYNCNVGGNKMSKKVQKIVIMLMLIGLLGSSLAVSIYYIVSAS